MKEILYFYRELNGDSSVVIPSLNHCRDYAAL